MNVQWTRVEYPDAEDWWGKKDCYYHQTNVGQLVVTAYTRHVEDTPFGYKWDIEQDGEVLAESDVLDFSRKSMSLAATKQMAIEYVQKHFPDEWAKYTPPPLHARPLPPAMLPFEEREELK